MSTFDNPKRNEAPANMMIQPQLDVGQKDDEHEKEADAVANKVMRMSDGEEGKVMKMSEGPTIQRMHEEDEDKIMKMSDGPQIQRMHEGPLTISRMSDGNGKGMSAPASVEAGINSSKGSGQSLPAGIQREMGNKMGADFSDVRVHTDASAAQMNKDINAKAFTHGQDIYFNQGQYNPSTSQGKHLLAHELTHTVQQGNTQLIQKKENNENSQIQEIHNYINAWENVTELWVNKSRDLISLNWDEYLSRTGASYDLSIAEDNLFGLFANAVGFAVEKVATSAILTAGAIGAAFGIVGGPIGEVAGGIAGLVVGLFVESALGLWQTMMGASENAQKAYDQQQKITKMITLKNIKFSKEKGDALMQVNQQAREFREFASDPNNIPHLSNFLGSLKEQITTAYEEYQKIDYNNLSFARKLLTEWMLQHSADPTSANQSTDSTNWQNAVKLLTGGDKALYGYPDLFIKQSLLEFDTLGLDKSKLNAISTAIHKVRKTMGRAGVDALLPAVMDNYDKDGKSEFKLVFSQTSTPEVLIKYINSEAINNLDEDAKSDIRNNKFELHLWFDLEVDDIHYSVYVEEWEWEIRYKDKAKGSFFHDNDDFETEPGQAQSI